MVLVVVCVFVPVCEPVYDLVFEDELVFVGEAVPVLVVEAE